MTSISDIEAKIDAVSPDRGPDKAAADYLQLAENVLEIWLEAHDKPPTQDTKEGFRLLALHRQGAKGDGSFNACRETCRELCYRYNLVKQANHAPEKLAAAQQMTLLTRHLYLFISGKMQVSGLGDFCCASKPLRINEQQLH